MTITHIEKCAMPAIPPPISHPLAAAKAHEEMIREGEEDHRNDSDGNDDESIKNRNREVLIDKLVFIMIMVVIIGVILFLYFIPH